MRDYYHQRRGTRPRQIDLATLNRFFLATYRAKESQGYFSEFFGIFCVDDGPTTGKAGQDISAFIDQKLYWPDQWPLLRTFEQGLDEEHLFTYVEFLFDLVSKPTEGWFHSYGGCGNHWSAWDKKAGQDEWRAEINSYLRHYGEGFELTEVGEVQRIGRDGLHELMVEAVECSKELPVQAKIAAAVRKYRLAKSTREERVEAVRDLVDLLEFHRRSVKEKLRGKDEDALYNIANNFAIRHYREDQKFDYDGEMLTWVFHMYLSTLWLVLDLNGRKAAKPETPKPVAPPEPEQPGDDWDDIPF